MPVVQVFERSFPLTKLAFAALLSLLAGATGYAGAPVCDLFGLPERVPIHGYAGTAMEPFVTRDGRYLLFNDSNAPFRNTDLHVARSIPGGFVYMGRMIGANSTDLDGVPSADDGGHLYFVSTRSYGRSLSTIYRARFTDGSVSGVELVPGVSRRLPGFINFDAEISYDGSTLVFVDGFFVLPVPYPLLADLVLARKDGSRFERFKESDRIFAAVNTEALEYAPAMSRDGLELYFTRAEHRPGAMPRIYASKRSRTSDPFGPPRIVESLKGFVEAPALSPDGRFLYLHRQDGNEFHVYRARRCAT